MKNVLVINGPNINMVGIREPQIYGSRTYADLVKYVEDSAKELGLSVTVTQSNHEGVIVDAIQAAYLKYDAIVINAGAYTHTSIAILDALKAVNIPTVEVHLSDINEREEFRKWSYISLYAEKKICGLGFEGYKKALEYIVNK